MAVLHCIWWESTLHLWGERDTVETAAPVSPSGEAQAHPFAQSHPELHAAAGEITPDGLLTSIASEASITLWLPAEGDRLLGSGDRRTAVTGTDGAASATLRLVTVPTLAFTPAEAIDLLTSLPIPLSPTSSESLPYFARLARHVAHLVACGQFAPFVEAGRDTMTSQWRAVVSGSQARERLMQLAQAMPPVCRACQGDRVTDLEPDAIVEDFLQSCSDGLVRRALDADEFFHQIHERAGEFGAPLELQWLSALMREDNHFDGADDAARQFVEQALAWVRKVDEGMTAIPTRLCFELIEPHIVLDALDDDDLLGAPEDDPAFFGTDERGTPEDAPMTVAEAVASADPDAERHPSAAGIATTLPTAASPWMVRLHLLTVGDDETLLDLAEAWAGPPRGAKLLRPGIASDRENLRTELARAAEVFPQLDRIVGQPAPTELPISVHEAQAFLRDYAPLLESRGFAVRLPEWALMGQRRVGLRLRLDPHERSGSSAVAGAGLGLASLVDFEWRIAVGDQEVSLEQFERLRARSAPLMRLQGEWIQLDPQDADAVTAFLAAQRTGTMTLGQALRSSAGAADLDVDVPVYGVDGSAWIEQLLRTVGDARFEECEQPDGFTGSMRAYQQRGLGWLSFMSRIGIGACLADDMGLGKTIELIALLLLDRQTDDRNGPNLIFAPMSVVGNWLRELQRFGPELRVLLHHGPERLAGDTFEAEANRCDAVVTTYALGHRDQELLSRIPWHRIVLDEAQKIKPRAAQTIAIRKLPSTHRIALTGTPLENHLSELWSIMEMLNPGLLGNAADFRKRFAVPVERLGDRDRAEQLKRLIKPLILRRVKSDPDVECDLPEKLEMPVYCSLTAEQAALYERVVGSMLDEVESATGIRRRGVILAALTHLKQICNHPAQYLHEPSPLDQRSGKCERLAEMLEEVVAEGEAALVFTQFRAMGELLVPFLTDRIHAETLFLHGGTPVRQRQAMIDRFQDPDGGISIFLLSLRAGGLGLNLTAANHVFHFDRWWNPAVEAQATDRAYRIGQTRRVQVYKFVCMGTIEDRIDRMLSEKVALADQIVGSGDDWLTGLSTSELREYLRLSRDAIGDT